MNITRFASRRLSFLLVAIPLGLSAQKTPVFEAHTDAPEVVEGSRFDVVFRLENAEGKQFKAPEFKDFRVVGGPNYTIGTTIINGQASTQMGWSFELVALKPGVFSIGSASIKVDGRTLQTRPIEVRVAPAGKSRSHANPPSGGDEALFLAVEFSKDEPYVGEQIICKVNVYSRVTVENPDILELPRVSGAFVREIKRFDTRAQRVRLRGKEYVTFTIYQQAIFPQTAGELLVEPAAARLFVVNPGTIEAFLGGRPVLLRSEPARISVRPLPAAPPANFCGVAGRYDWKVLVQPDSLSTDDAATLTVQVRGTGDARQFAAPKISAPPGLEIFEPKVKMEEEYENGQEQIHEKTLEYVLLPKAPGDYVLTPELVYFNPDSNRFTTLRVSEPLRLHVVAGKNYIAPGASIDDPQTNTSGQYDDEKNGLKNVLSWALPLLALFSLAWFLLRRKRSSEPAKTPERLEQAPPPESLRPALEESEPTPIFDAREKLTAARRYKEEGASRAFYNEIYKALQGRLASVYGISPAALSPDHLHAQLQEKGLDETQIGLYTRLLQTCEQVLYAGFDRSADMEQVWENTQTLMEA